eukprot:313829_1
MGCLLSQNLNILHAVCDESNVNGCNHIKNLSIMMRKYTSGNLNIESVNIDKVLDDYLHLFSHHKNDDAFEYVYNLFGGFCDAKKCGIVSAKCKRKIDEIKLNSISVDTIVKKQIFDKIHCHYQHAYDIGFKLTKREKNILFHMTHKEENEVPINNQITGIFEILQKKHTLLSCFRRRRFQFNIEMQNNNVTHDQKYHYGFEFEYEKEHHDADDYKNVDYYIGYIEAVFSSFKEEMISTGMLIQQFNNELKKAEKHFISNYCKIAANEGFNNKNSRFKLQLHHVLAVMIYCNFDKLQFEFSKSYRKLHQNETKQSVSKRHQQFWYLGRYLRQSIQLFGIWSPTALYHGTSKQLVIPIDFLNRIYIPWSTSSSVAVAIHFAGENGIITEISGPTASNPCCSCAWLSDFPNEQEMLFVQNGVGLHFTNIIDCRSGHEYWMILKAIDIVSGRWYSKSRINVSLQTLTLHLILNELGRTKFESLTPYAKKLFHQFRMTADFRRINWDKMKSIYAFLFELYCLKQFEWINMDFMSEFYVNLER